MRRGSLCAVDVDISRSKVQPETLRELQLTCEEVEALYAVGFQKVSNHCKDEPVMLNFDVDWASCLTAHYPWVKLLETKICILKSDSNMEFLACYCSGDGNISKRGLIKFSRTAGRTVAPTPSVHSRGRTSRRY